MWARLSIVAGLVVGVAAAGLLLGGLLALAPVTPLPSVAAPSAPVASAAPSVAPPSASPVPSVAPASAPADAPSHIDQPAPALVLSQVGGGMVDLENFTGTPVWLD